MKSLMAGLSAFCVALLTMIALPSSAFADIVVPPPVIIHGTWTVSSSPEYTISDGNHGGNGVSVDWNITKNSNDYNAYDAQYFCGHDYNETPTLGNPDAGASGNTYIYGRWTDIAVQCSPEVVRKIVIYASHNGSYTGVDASFTLKNQSANSCNYLIRASYIDHDLAVYIKTTDVDPDGWDVFVPSTTLADPEPNGRVMTTHIDPIQVPGAAPDWYGTVITLTGPQTPAILTYSVVRANDHACSQLGNLSTSTVAAPDNADGSPGGTTCEAGDCTGSTDGGIHCGGWTDIFCHIKAALYWAFVPDSATYNAWQTHITSLQNRGPIGVALGGGQFVSAVVSQINTCSGTLLQQLNGDDDCYGQLDSTTHDFTFKPTGHGTPQDPSYSFDPLQQASGSMHGVGHNIYDLGNIAIVGAFCFWLWHRVAKSVGGKEE